jgi:hypothetical protein
MALHHFPKITTDGLVLCLDAGNPLSYPGSGTVWSDLSGNGNNGMLVNGVGYNSNNGGSLVFDGSNGYGSASGYSSLNNPYATHEVFIKLNNPFNSVLNFILARASNSIGTFTLRKNSNNLLDFVMRVSDNNLAYTTTFNQPINTNWMHLVATYDGVILSLYFNGLLDNTSSLASGPLNTGTLYIPGNGYGITIAVNNNLFGGTFLNCNIGVVRIYNRALSANEVLQNYKALKGRYGL